MTSQDPLLSSNSSIATLSNQIDYCNCSTMCIIKKATNRHTVIISYLNYVYTFFTRFFTISGKAAKRSCQLYILNALFSLYESTVKRKIVCNVTTLSGKVLK